MSFTFQECPGCDCLIPVDDYAEQRLPDRTMHLMHCRFCKVGSILVVNADGKTLRMDLKSPETGYTEFLRLLDEVHRGKSAVKTKQIKQMRKTARAA